MKTPERLGAFGEAKLRERLKDVRFVLAQAVFDADLRRKLFPRWQGTEEQMVRLLLQRYAEDTGAMLEEIEALKRERDEADLEKQAVLDDRSAASDTQPDNPYEDWTVKETLDWEGEKEGKPRRYKQE